MKVDMSAQAIALRLKLVSQLRDLWLSLGKAKKTDPQNYKVSSTASLSVAASK